MADHSQDPDLRAVVAAALIEHDRGAEYDRSQREATAGGGNAGDQPRPLEFDARGFPIARPVPHFMRRVRRLLGDA
jgi:hypothetical protein